MNSETLLQVENVQVSFPIGRRSQLRAVDDVSLDIADRGSLGLVGESGCGKTTVARAVGGLVAATDGSIRYRGVPMATMTPQQLREHRREVQMVFQDPLDSLNPRKTVSRTLRTPLAIHRRMSRQSIPAEAQRLLEQVGLQPAVRFLSRYPHELSGGQRQRVGIARALAAEPALLIGDEPVASLDVTVQAQMVRTFQQLRSDLGIALLLISHDLRFVAELCDEVAVMYLGRVVEQGPTADVFSSPRHPYTAALLSAEPIPDPVKARARTYVPASGEVPSALNPPSGCRFRTRCPLATEACLVEPDLDAVASGHRTRCHYPDAVEAPLVMGR